MRRATQHPSTSASPPLEMTRERAAAPRRLREMGPTSTETPGVARSCQHSFAKARSLAHARPSPPRCLCRRPLLGNQVTNVKPIPGRNCASSTPHPPRRAARSSSPAQRSRPLASCASPAAAMPGPSPGLRRGLLGLWAALGLGLLRLSGKSRVPAQGGQGGGGVPGLEKRPKAPPSSLLRLSPELLPHLKPWPSPLSLPTNTPWRP